MSTIRALLVVVLVASCQVARAHPSHSSVTEIEWNPATHRFEVAMRLHIPDLEDGISAVLKQRVRLSDTSESAEHVRDYLKTHFVMTTNAQQECRLHWVGMEFELHDVWLYFEVENINRKSNSNISYSKPQTERVKTWNELFDRNPQSQSKAKSSSTQDENLQRAQTTIRRTDLDGVKKARLSSKGLTRVSIRNSSLMEIQPEQTNVVALTIGRRTTSAVLKRDQFTRAFYVDEKQPRGWQPARGQKTRIDD